MRKLSIRVRSWCVRSACASVPYAHAQYTHQSLHDAYAQHGMKALLKFGFFTRMLSIRLRNWSVCSACASVLDAYAQQAHQFLARMLRVHISPWCVCSACFEGNALLKIILSIRIRNFAASNRPLNICLHFFILTPKSPSGRDFMV